MFVRKYVPVFGDAHWKNYFNYVTGRWSNPKPQSSQQQEKQGLNRREQIKLNIHLYINKELVPPTTVVVNNKTVKERTSYNVSSKETRTLGNVTIESLKHSVYDLNHMFSLRDNQLGWMFISYDEDAEDEKYGHIDLDWKDSNLNESNGKRNSAKSRMTWKDRNISIHMLISIESVNDSRHKNHNIDAAYLEHSLQNTTNKEQVDLLRSVEKSRGSILITKFSFDNLLNQLLLYNSNLEFLASLKADSKQITLKRSNSTTCIHCVLLCWITEHWHLIVTFGPVSMIFLYKKCKIFSKFLKWLMHHVSSFVKLYVDINITDIKHLSDFEKNVQESCYSLCTTTEKQLQKTLELYEQMQEKGCSCQENIGKLKVGVDKLRFALKNLKSDFLRNKKRMWFYLKKSLTLSRYMRIHLRECEEKLEKQLMKSNSERMPGEQIRQRGQGEFTEVINQTPQFVRFHCKTKRLSKRKLHFVIKPEAEQRKLRNVKRKCKHTFFKRSKSLPLKQKEDNPLSAQKINSDSVLISKKELTRDDFDFGGTERQLTFDHFSLQANPLFKKQKSQHLENSI